MSFPFVERGLKPPREAGHPDASWKALWRGKKAGGKDEGGYKIEAVGQMPKDDVLRPSTLPGSVLRLFDTGSPSPVSEIVS